MRRSAILAGGGARRLGGIPKGLLEVGGRRILDRVVDAAVAAFGSLPILVAGSPEAAAWRSDLVVHHDAVSKVGPLGGLLTAVELDQSPVVCLAWDMPFLEPHLLRLLASAIERFDVVLPASKGPRGVEPLCAAYGPACSGPIRKAITRGRHDLVGWQAGLHLEHLDPTTVARFGDPSRLFLNVNTPEDLVRANHLA